LAPFADLVADEVNVKAVEFTDDVQGHCQQVLTVVPRVLGPRLGGQVQQVIRAVKAGEWSLVDDQPVAAGLRLEPGEYELRLVAADAEHSAPLPGGEGVVVLDTELTPELVSEGVARDVVRVVQQARREAGLNVADRIALVVEAPDEVAAAVDAHRYFIAGEVLAESVKLGPVGAGAFEGEVGDGVLIRVAVTKR
jgi:isoleucyl-tRNA synthetase